MKHLISSSIVGSIIFYLFISSNMVLANSGKPKIIFFDVNETLLDLNKLKVPVGKALDGREDLLPLWFSTMLHHSLVSSVTNEYQDFGAIGVASLQMVAEINGITISQEQARQAIIPTFTSLPPHPEVHGALKKLKDAGFRIATFTNSSKKGIDTQLKNAKLDHLFEERITVEDTKIFKPDLRVYAQALNKLSIAPEDAMMVAAHGWDIAGIKAAGMTAVFIARPGKTLYPLAQKPDYIVQDLNGLVELLMEKSK